MAFGESTSTAVMLTYAQYQLQCAWPTSSDDLCPGSTPSRVFQHAVCCSCGVFRKCQTGIVKLHSSKSSPVISLLQPLQN